MAICQYVYNNFFQLFFHNGLHASHILSCAQYLHITESGFYFMEISHEMKKHRAFLPDAFKRRMYFYSIFTVPRKIGKLLSVSIIA